MNASKYYAFSIKVEYSTALGPDFSLDLSSFLWLWGPSDDPQCAHLH